MFFQVRESDIATLPLCRPASNDADGWIDREVPSAIFYASPLDPRCFQNSPAHSSGFLLPVSLQTTTRARSRGALCRHLGDLR
jgi:hypothetical protein